MRPEPTFQSHSATHITMAVTRAILVFAACLLLVPPVQAQQRAALRVAVAAQPARSTAEQPLLAPSDSSTGSDRGKRILVEAGVGVVVGGVVGGLSARNGDTGTSIDAVATGASVVAGALLGALVGGIVGALWH